MVLNITQKELQNKILMNKVVAILLRNHLGWKYSREIEASTKIQKDIENINKPRI